MGSVNRGLRTGLLVGGGVVIAGSGGYLIYQAVKGTGVAGAASSQVSLAVLGYQVFPGAQNETVATSTLSSQAVLPGPGSAFGAAVQVTNLAPSAQTIGVRGWIIQPGNEDPTAYLTGGVINGTVEGHMFPAANPTSATPETGTVQLAAASFLSKPKAILGFYSAPVTGGVAAPGNYLNTLGVLWAAGPVAAVAALPARSGNLPTPGSNGIAYVWDPTAIRTNFNLETGAA